MNLNNLILYISLCIKKTTNLFNILKMNKQQKCERECAHFLALARIWILHVMNAGTTHEIRSTFCVIIICHWWWWSMCSFHTPSIWVLLRERQALPLYGNPSTIEVWRSYSHHAFTKYSSFSIWRWGLWLAFAVSAPGGCAFGLVHSVAWGCKGFYTCTSHCYHYLLKGRLSRSRIALMRVGIENSYCIGLHHAVFK